MLRRPTSRVVAPATDVSPVSVVSGDQDSWLIRTPLRWRLGLLTFAVVAFVVGAMTFLAYWTVSDILTGGVDRTLDEKADVVMSQTTDPAFVARLDEEIEHFKHYNPGYRLSVSPPGWSFSRGDAIPVGGEVRDASDSDEAGLFFRTVGNERVLTTTGNGGSTVVLAVDMRETHRLISILGMLLLVIAALGTVLAIAAGLIVASAGLKPLQRLQRAADYVTDTDDLRPIAVYGSDELASLTASFNAMLGALQESRTRQAQLVADAGHELKTPLTSMRTNIELLMMLNRPDANGRISEEDRRDLERDVMAQMSELSTLIGDLVDLTREDASDTVMEPVELDEIISSSLARVRRRTDVTFDVDLIPWSMTGDQFSLGRATLNLLDNAAKWSPSGSVVRVRMVPLSDARVELSIADSGPGIRQEDRERVFERFFRAPEARSQPGSGLGLAIVKQAVVRHAGTIRVAESDDGGALLIVEFPGLPQVIPSR